MKVRSCGVCLCVCVFYTSTVHFNAAYMHNKISQCPPPNIGNNKFYIIYYILYYIDMVSTYTTCIRIPYRCFDKPLSSSGGSSEGVPELRIHLHIKYITH
jgi:hypothetical protein